MKNRTKKPNKRQYAAMQKRCETSEKKAPLLEAKSAVQICVILYEYLPWPEYGEGCWMEVYDFNFYAYMFNQIWLAAQSQSDQIVGYAEDAKRRADTCLTGIIV